MENAAQMWNISTAENIRNGEALVILADVIIGCWIFKYMNLIKSVKNEGISESFSQITREINATKEAQ